MQSHHTQIPDRHDGTQTLGNLELFYIKNKTISFFPSYERTRQLFPRNADNAHKLNSKTSQHVDTKNEK